MSLSSPLTAEQILNRVAERGDDALNTAVALIAFAVALIESSDEKEDRISLSWHLRNYADFLDGVENGGTPH
jgi:hypothetical protein